MFALIMIVRGFEYTNITGMKLVRGTCCQVLKVHNEYAHEKNNCDSSEPGYVHLSYSLMQSCEACHTLTV